MSLSFQNAYTEKVYISVVLFDRGCPSEPWRKMGFYAASPGAKVDIILGDLRGMPNHNFCWFAVARDSSGPTWSGDHWYRIPLNAVFNQCYTDDTGCNALRAFHAGFISEEFVGLTILLLAPGAADKEDQGFAWAVPVYPPDPPPRKKPAPHR